MTRLPFILGMSGGEIAFILFVALLVFGPDKIPQIARNLGKGIRTVRDATDEIKNEITKSVKDGSSMKDDAKQGFKETAEDLKEGVSKVKEDIEKITGPVKRKF